MIKDDNDKYFEIKKAEQLKILADQITGESLPTGRNILRIFPIEAGLGKTTTMIESLLKLHKERPEIKTLIVTQYKKEARRLKKKLGDFCTAIYSGIKNNYSKDEILNTPVVVITHSRCKGLYNYLGQADWELYSSGRKNLIIDEEFDVTEVVVLNEDEYEAARNIILAMDISNKELFDRAFSKIKHTFNKISNSEPGHDMIKNSQPLSNKSRECLDKVIKKAARTQNNHDFYESLAYYNYDDRYLLVSSFKDLMDILKKMKMLLNSSFWIYNRRGIYCLDNTAYKLLENNIILDASASMNPIYESSDLFEIVPMERIVDHSNWTINVCDINSSASKKREYSGYYESIRLQIIKVCQNKENKLLVVGSKKDVEWMKRLFPDFLMEYKNQVSIQNFGYIRGRNKWWDYNCCLIVHTCNLPSYIYPLKARYYLPRHTLKSADLFMCINTGQGNRAHFGYINSTLLDNIREGILAAATYQAIKRINRWNDKKAQVYLVTNNLNMLHILKKNMVGAKFKRFTLPNQDQFIKEKERTYTRKEDSIYIKRLKALFSEMCEGKHRHHECSNMLGYYTKRWCMNMIDYGGKNFGRFLNKLEAFMIENGIEKNQHKIIVAKYI